MINPSLADRFWAKVDRRGADDCWEWNSARNPKGYGQFQIGTKRHTATHMALLWDGRPRPSGKSWALHSCDNPPCCNPAHLRWGTPRENAADRDVRRRQIFSKGEQCSWAKLNEEKVLRAIRDPRGIKEVAQDLGVSESLISLVRNGKVWAHVTGIKYQRKLRTGAQAVAEPHTRRSQPNNPFTGEKGC